MTDNNEARDPKRTISPRWPAIALVAAALVLMLLVVMTPHNDTTPDPDTTNSGPSIVQPVQPTPRPNN